MVAEFINHFEAIEDFRINKESWLKQYPPIENGIPSHDRIFYVFSRLNPKQVQTSFISWVSSCKQIAILQNGIVSLNSSMLIFTLINCANYLI